MEILDRLKDSDQNEKEVEKSRLSKYRADQNEKEVEKSRLSKYRAEKGQRRKEKRNRRENEDLSKHKNH